MVLVVKVLSGLLLFRQIPKVRDPIMMKYILILSAQVSKFRRCWDMWCEERDWTDRCVVLAVCYAGWMASPILFILVWTHRMCRLDAVSVNNYFFLREGLYQCLYRKHDLVVFFFFKQKTAYEMIW